MCPCLRDLLPVQLCTESYGVVRMLFTRQYVRVYYNRAPKSIHLFGALPSTLLFVSSPSGGLAPLSRYVSYFCLVAANDVWFIFPSHWACGLVTPHMFRYGCNTFFVFPILCGLSLDFALCLGQLQYWRRHSYAFVGILDVA